jgi:hypothetical protein
MCLKLGTAWCQAWYIILNKLLCGLESFGEANIFLVSQAISQFYITRSVFIMFARAC